MHAYPISLNQTFYSLLNPVSPLDIDNDSSTNYTLKYWGYVSFINDSNMSYYSEEGLVNIYNNNEKKKPILQRLLNATSVLNYILKDLFLWKSLFTNYTSNYFAIYFGFETDDLFIYYPGRINYYYYLK